MEIHIDIYEDIFLPFKLVFVAVEESVVIDEARRLDVSEELGEFHPRNPGKAQGGPQDIRPIRTGHVTSFGSV